MKCVSLESIISTPTESKPESRELHFLSQMDAPRGNDMQNATALKFMNTRTDSITTCSSFSYTNYANRDI